MVGYCIILCGDFNIYTDKKDVISQQPMIMSKVRKALS